MKKWLSERFVTIGIVAATVDIVSRLLSHFGLDYLVRIAGDQPWTLEYTARIARAFGVVDVAASALWWAFMFRLAFQILERLEQAEPT